MPPAYLFKPSVHITLLVLLSHTNKPIMSTFEIQIWARHQRDSNEIVSSSYFEIPILYVASFAALSSGNFHGVSRVEREGRKVKEGWLPELVTAGAVRKT